MTSFKDFDLLPSLQATLAEKSFTQPTEIQARALPLLLKGRSLVGVSETGSGKTLSYALPVLDSLKRLENGGSAVAEDARPRALVLVPTRDLGEQVSKVFKTFTHETRLRVRTSLGGTALDVNKRDVQGMFEVLVATPGRLIKLLDRKLIDLSDVRTLVFDEADEMLDEGFIANANRIAKECPAKVQRVLFSATVSHAVQALIKNLLGTAEVIRTAGSHRLVPTLKTRNRTVEDGKRFPVLMNVLAEKAKGGTLIFTNTREQCDRLAAELKGIGREVSVYRGEMDRLERRTNLRSFRDGTNELLICTDVAARGLDVEHVGRVINYHLPQELDNYIHRVGRTARAGREGLVVNLVTERDAALLAKVDTIRPEQLQA